MRIDGDVAAAGSFGLDIIGIGRFYSSTTNNALVVAAPYSTVNGVATAGELYVYSGVSGTPASAALTSYASHLGGTVNDSTGNSGLGENGLGVMGNLGPNGQPTLGVFMPYYPATGEPGRVELFSGASSGGLFDSSQWLASAASNLSSRFGRLVVGGAIRGTNSTVSFIGTSKSDVIVASRTGAIPELLIVDGTKLALAGGITYADTVADVVLPTNFTDYGFLNTPAADLDKDGYADFAVGEAVYPAPAVIAGQVRVYR
jgi:hypothetical protein